MSTDALQRLADQLAIRELVARYDDAIDEGRPDEWVATFVPDGTFESSALGAHAGGDGLLAFATGHIAAVEGRHCTTDFVVDVDGDDARSRCSLIAVSNAAAPIASTTAVHDDVLRRTDDGWLFVHGKVTPDIAIH
jgi:hypothetical protein